MYDELTKPSNTQIILLALGIPLLLIAFSSGWFFVFIVIVIWLPIVLYFKTILEIIGINLVLFLKIIVLLWVSMVLFLTMVPGDSNGSGTNGGLTYDQLKQYDGKRLEITSSSADLVGIADLYVKEGSSVIQVDYTFRIDADLPVNGICAGLEGKGERCPYTQYDYSVDLVDDDVDGEGILSVSYCNFDKFPKEAYDGLFYARDNCGVKPSDPTPITSHFNANFGLGFSNYQEIIDANVLRVMDSSPFWTFEKSGPNGFNGSNDDDRAAQEGQAVRTFQLEYQLSE